MGEWRAGVRWLGARMTDVTAQTAQGDFQRTALILKRMIDLIGASFGLLIAAPAFALILSANAVQGTPTFFSQSRVGKGGKRFACFKFRSMRIGAEALLVQQLAADPMAAMAWDRRQKLADDPRVTVVGRFIRRWGIDELPQLINVLRGDMSLVGPRPVVAPEVGLYGGDAAYCESADFATYLTVRPGITGLWQVAAPQDADYAARRLLDRQYVDQWGLLLDLRILLQTPLALMRRRHG